MRILLILLLFTIFSLITLSLLPTPTAAQCAGTPVYRTAPAYHAPTYHEPAYHETVVVQPLLIPATVFQFLPAFQPPQAAPAVAVQAGAAAPSPAAAMVGQHSGPQIPPLRGGGAGAGVAAESLSLPTALADGAEAGTVSAEVPPGPAAVPNASPSQGVDLPSATTSTADAVSVLNNRCAKCHTGPSSDGKRGKPFTIFSGPNTLAPLGAGDRALIALSTRTAWMPKGANRNPRSPLACTDAECEAIDRWADGQ